MRTFGAGSRWWQLPLVVAFLLTACAGPPAPPAQVSQSTATPSEPAVAALASPTTAPSPTPPPTQPLPTATAGATSLSPTPGVSSPTPMPVAVSTPVPATATPIEQTSFARDVLPIFEQRCVRCHSGPQAPWQLQLTSYENVMKGSVQYKVIIPGDPAGSFLYQYVESEFMPLGGPPLTMEQKETIRKWIQAGAPNN